MRKKGTSRFSRPPLGRTDIEMRFRKELGLTGHGAKAMINALINVYFDHLVEGGTLEFRNVGKIESSIRAARKHHMVVDGGTGGRMKNSPARRLLKFSRSGALRRNMVNARLAEEAKKKKT